MPARAQAEAGPALSLPSANEPLHITADVLDWDVEKDMLVIEGGVVVTHPDYIITADRAEADIKSGLIKASGNVTVVSISDGETARVVTAEEAEIDADDATGWMLKSKVAVPWEDTTFRFEGERIERIDENTYLVGRGRFTWCDCGEGGTPDWSVRADEMTAKTEGDVVARGARVYIRDLPVMTLPYFRYPIGTQRRSGFLFPIIETSSSDGIQIELPYYIVLGRSMDATIGPRWIEDRGVEVGAEFRYNFGEVASGELRSSVIDDGLEGTWRDGVRLIHRTDIGEEYTLAADVAVIGDNEVLFDFDHRGLGEERRRALESRILLSRHWPGMNLSSEFSLFDDLMGGDVRESPFGEDRDGEMVQRLPSITYNLIAAELYRPLYFDLNAGAVNYYRPRTGLPSGRMATLFPSIVAADRLFGAVDFLAAGGYRGYYLDADPAAEDGDDRFAGRAEAELAVSAQWERFFEGDKRKYRHSVRPEALVFYAQDPGYDDDDFFADILPAADTILAGVHIDNRLWSRTAGKSPARISETARFELTQLYDYDKNEWRDLRIEARLGSPSPFSVSVDAYHGWEEWEWTRVVTAVSYHYLKAFETGVGYRYDSGNVRSPYFEFETAPNEAVHGWTWVRPNPRNKLTYTAYYSIEHGQLVYQTFEWDSVAPQKCWGLNVMLRDRVRPSDPDGEHEIGGSINLRVEAPDRPR